MNTVELARRVEQTIQLILVAARWRNPQNYAASRLFVWDQVLKTDGKHGVITVGFFSRIIGDMKRTGIIGTVKGGDALFLTDEYWKLSGNEKAFHDYQHQREQLAVKILHDLEAPRTRDYFKSYKEEQSMVDAVLSFYLEIGDIEFNNEHYQWSASTRASVSQDAKKASDKAGA
jgi:hypothetical protein